MGKLPVESNKIVDLKSYLFGCHKKVMGEYVLCFYANIVGFMHCQLNRQYIDL